MIELGSRVRDRISGFTGIAGGHATYLYGCEQLCIVGEELKDGKPVGAEWFDIQRVEVVEAKAEAPAQPGSSGGPQAFPPPTC